MSQSWDGEPPRRRLGVGKNDGVCLFARDPYLGLPHSSESSSETSRFPKPAITRSSV